MKKYLIPVLLGVTILGTSVTMGVLGTSALSGNRTGTIDENRNYSYRGGMMGSYDGTNGYGYRGGMMGGTYNTAISTDLSGSAYDQTTLKAALDVVLADEYKARAQYQAIVAQFGAVNPYVQLIQAETNHINALTRVYQAFGFTVPADNGSSFASVPATLQASYQIGIDAETANIALYQTDLNTDLPTSIARIFANLQNASKNHLAVFTAYQSGDTTGWANGCPMLDNDNR